MNEKPDERAENGAVFDRDTYLRDTEGFDDVEVNSILSFKFYSQNCKGCGGRTQQCPGGKEGRESGEAVPSLQPEMGQGLPEEEVGLGGGGRLRQAGLCQQHQPQASEGGSLSMSGGGFILLLFFC